jgi:hypothetical protein
MVSAQRRRQEDHSLRPFNQKKSGARHQWLTPMILHYLGGWDQEGPSSRPAKPNNSQEPISKITRVKWTGSVAQAVEHLLCKYKALSSNPSSIKKKKRGVGWGGKKWGRFCCKVRWSNRDQVCPSIKNNWTPEEISNGFQDTGHEAVKNSDKPYNAPDHCPGSFHVMIQRGGIRKSPTHTLSYGDWAQSPRKEIKRGPRVEYQRGQRCTDREPQRSAGMPPWVFSTYLWGKRTNHSEGLQAQDIEYSVVGNNQP